jgi:hypothetical protein
MTCLNGTAPTLFDQPFTADLPREHVRSCTAIDLFDFLPDLSRRIRQEFTPRPEEDLERWDGLS